MKFSTLILMILIFCVIQTILHSKAKKVWFKYFLFGVTALVLLVCLALYSGNFGTSASTRYMALFLCFPFSASLIGCTIGILVSKLIIKKKNN